MHAGYNVFPAVGLVVSGGHTNLYDCPEPTGFELLGSTIDDAAGEAFDKVAAILGLPYPGGPSIQAAAASGSPTAFRFPRTFLKDADRLEFSFSGLKTAVLYEVAGTPPRECDRTALAPQYVADVAASFQEAVVDVLVAKCRQALAARGRQTLCVGGGVAANTRLRDRLEEAARADGFTLVIAPQALCTDNAAMSAIAWELLALGNTASLDIDVSAGLVRRR
jgi:N6-L-threonylcarbamoyladenine synthase